MNQAKIVVFLKYNTRILVNADPGKYKLFKNAVINPDLSKVRSVPPHFWKLYDGEIVPMTDKEQHIRLKEISRYGIDNHIRSLKPRQFRPRRIDWLLIRISIAAMVLGTVGFYGILFMDEAKELWRNRESVVACLSKSNSGRRFSLIPGEINQRVSREREENNGKLSLRKPVSE
jgi:hypothetical protein